MWPFTKRTDKLASTAEAAAPLLISHCENAAPALFTALGGDDHAENRPDVLTSQTLELIVFAVHLADRITLGKLGAPRSKAVIEALLPGVRNHLSPPFNDTVQDLYNARNSFYKGIEKLVPGKNGKQAGTLFWEFGKTLGFAYAGGKPAAIAQATTEGENLMFAVEDILTRSKVI